MKPPVNIPLKVAILQSKKTQKAIARKARIAEPRMSLIVRGHERPTDHERAALARVLGMDESALFEVSA